MEKFYIGGEWVSSSIEKEIFHPFDGHSLGSICLAEPQHIDQAVVAAQQSFPQTKSLSPYEKVAILDYIVQELTKQTEDFAQLLVLENGKTIKEARGEVARTISTFRIARAEAERIDGDSFDLGATAASKNRYGIVKKFPIGIIAGIVPFNFPLNLAAHKIAPAFATGCPIIIKPATQTSLSMLRFAHIISASGWPVGAFSVVPCDRVVGQQLVEDGRIALLSFTGSPDVGRKMKQQAGKKKVVLELGGNAAVIIDEGQQDWDWIVSRVLMGSYYQAGQSCISVQRIYCHHSHYAMFKEKFVAAITSLRVGNPFDESTTMGSVIDKKNTERLQSWIDSAVSHGAVCLAGGLSSGTVLQPTLLENVPLDSELFVEEAFGPVTVLSPFDNFYDVISSVNHSKFGLQVGIFSPLLDHVWQLFEYAEVGGVVHNDVPSFRSDSMPYGGVKDSGFGREGVRYAMKDMLEDKVLIIKS